MMDECTKIQGIRLEYSVTLDM